jgi:hypothetical protein
VGALPGLIVGHGGTLGLIAELGAVVAGLAIFGYFIRRAAKKEREREADRENTG